MHVFVLKLQVREESDQKQPDTQWHLTSRHLAKIPPHARLPTFEMNRDAQGQQTP